MTAIQELWAWIDANCHEETFNINDAREMSLRLEKEQIENAYEMGWVNGDWKKAPSRGSDYYDQIFKNKRK
jgi:hypothetical protein